MPNLRVLGRAFLVLFAISTAFPVVASFIATDEVPQLLGLADVAIAAVTAVTGFLLEARARELVTDSDRAQAWQIMRVAATGVLLLLALFFVAPDALHWDVLLIGLGWRAWLGVWVLPSLLASLRKPA